MTTNDPTDNAYAQACQNILENETLSIEEIESKLSAAGASYYLGDDQPKNLMLSMVHAAVEFDELDPGFGDSGEGLKRLKG